MNMFKKAAVMLALGVGSLFIGLGAADAQWGYRGGYGGYAPRYYGGGYGGGYRSYYGAPVYRSYGYGGYNNYRPYGGGGYYGGRNYYGGGSGVFIGRGGIGIGF